MSYPVRASAMANLLQIPLCLAAAQLAVFPHLPFTMLCLAGAALPGAILGLYPLDHLIFPNLTFRRWLHEVTTAWILRFLFVTVFVVAIIAMPSHLDWDAAAVAFGVVGIQALLVWGGSLWLAKQLRLIVPAPPRLMAIVGTLADRFGLPVPNTWILRGIVCNAYALPFTNTLLVSESLEHICTDEELTAVCAHEFGHLSETRPMLATRLFGSLALLPILFIKPAFTNYSGFGLIALGVAMMMISRTVKSFARRMEDRADRIAHSVEGPEAMFYAGALAKLYEFNQMPAVMPGKRQIHPHLYDRLLAAGVTPDYPRPAAAVSRTTFAKFLYILLIALVALGVFRHLNAEEAFPDEATSAQTSISFITIR